MVRIADRHQGERDLLSQTARVSFVTALKAPQIRALVKEGCLQLSMFDELNLAEIACEKLYPGQRLVVCRNPLVAEERARKRSELLAGTEKDLGELTRRVQAGTLQGQAEIGLAVGAVWNRYKVKKHFQVTITDDTLTYERKRRRIAQEAELDGIYVIRAGRIEPHELAAAGIVRAYKQLKEAEKGFRRHQGPAGGPPDPPPPGRPRPLTPADLHARRVSALAPAPRVGRTALSRRQPPLAHRPRRQGHPLAGSDPQGRPPPQRRHEPCHTIQSLLDELENRTRNTIRVTGTDATFPRLSTPTELQARALELINERIPQST